MTPAFVTFTSRLLDIAAEDEDPAAVANALAKLHRLVFFNLLPPGARPRLLSITRRCLARTDAPIVWLAAIDVAVATGDYELRATVEAIASGKVERTLAGHRDLGLWVRSAAQRALSASGDWTRAVGTA